MDVERLSAGRPDASDTVDALVKLQARFGGLGILSYADCSTHAKAAAQDDSDAVLAPLLGSQQANTLPAAEAAQPGNSLQPHVERTTRRSLQKLGLQSQKLLVEATSIIGRR